jgi:hypothetical protein
LEIILEILAAAALLIAVPAVSWFARALFDYFLTSQGDFWRLVAEYPEQALAFLAAERSCLIDPRSRPSGYIGPFFVLGHRIYLPFEGTEAIKARVAQKLRDAALQRRLPPGMPVPNDPDVLRRSVRFVGWSNADRPGRISVLKWWTGLGWSEVAVFGAACAVAIFAEGVLQIVAVGAAISCFFLLAYRCFWWNGPAWARVHRRAMLIYAELARHEVLCAEQEDRMFDRFAVWRELAVAISHGQARKEAVEAMIHALKTEDGAYFGSLFDNFGAKALPKIGARVQLADRVRGLMFGPQLVVCQIVENTFGPEEAVRYILAILKSGAL